MCLDTGGEIIQNLLGPFEMPSSIKQWIEGSGTQESMSRCKPSRLLRFVAIYVFAVPMTLLAQAAMEYALKSGGTISANSSGNATLAGCRMDSALPTCLSRAYPQTTIVVVVLVCLLVVRWLAGIAGNRAH